MKQPSSSIVAVSFDADGTLFDFDQVMRQALGHALDELRRRVPDVMELTVEALIQHRNDVAEELRGQTSNLEDIRLAAFKRTLEHIGVVNDTLAADLHTLYLKHRFEDIVLYGDVLPALSALGKGYRLGLLSNGNSYPERCGLDGWFAFVVFAYEHRIEKPDPQLFEIAIKRAGCERHQIVHVGDSLRNDVFGAQSVGIHAIWLNRDGVGNKTDIQPDFEISSLTEVVGVCEAIEQRMSIPG